MDDFSGLSSRGAIYAESEAYSGEALINPMIEDRYRNISSGLMTLERHGIIGTGTSIMLGVKIGEGTAVGSMPLVNRILDA